MKKIEENNEIQDNIDVILNNLWEFSNWLFRLTEFIKWLDNDCTDKICTILDSNFNLK